MTPPGALLLKDGLVVDGSGAPGRHADVLVAGGRIVEVGEGVRPVGDARVIDCADRVVAPGFIDLHTHSDLTLLRYPRAMTRLLQGVTTEVTGNCGMSPFPVAGEARDSRAIVGPLDVVPELSWDWRDEREYLDRLRAARPGVNVAPLIGHGSVRQWANGSAAELADDALGRMVDEIARLLAAGMWGVSLGLMYAPGESSTDVEREAVGRAVADRDGLVSVHMRSYASADILRSLHEMLAVSDETGVRLQLSHLRTIGDTDAVAMREAIALLDAQGPAVAADAYPYLAGHTTLLQLLAPPTRAAGTSAALDLMRRDPAEAAAQIRRNGIGPEAITIAKCADDSSVGRTLEELAARGGRDWAELAVQLLVDADGSVDIIAVGSDWADTLASLSHPRVCIASDGVSLDLDHRTNLAHPRSVGTFPAALRLLIDHGIPVEEAVRKCTSFPASRLGMDDRGLLAPGLWADVVVFDPSCVADRSDYLTPLRPPEGIDYVIVNGVLAVAGGELASSRSGRVLLRRT